MKKKKIVIVVIIALLAIIAGIIIGTSYAWFKATVNGIGKEVTATTANLALTFTDGSVINGTKITPGWTKSKTFTVQNSGDTKTTYDIDWSAVTNTFTNSSDITYTLTGTGTGAGSKTQTTFPTTAGTIVSNISIEPGVTHTYTLTVAYEYKATDQSADMSKTFAGTIALNAKKLPEATN